jgi:tetratricopeptide (TPR) repeat protein
MQPPMLNASIRAFFLGSALILTLPGCASKAERAAEALALGQQLAAAGQIAEAKTAIMKSIAIRDDVADTWFALGQVHMATSAIPEAFTAFGRADELRPGNVETLRPLAYAGYMIGATQLSKDAVDRLLALAPDDPQGLAVSGLLALDKGQPDVTIAAADKILAALPNDETGILLKARAIAVQGKIDDAIKMLKDAQATEASKPSINSALLQLYRAKRDVAGMLSVFPGLLAVQKENFDLALDYSNVLYRTGQIDAARKIWSDAVVQKRADGKAMAWAFELYDNAEPTDRPAYLDERLTKMGGSPLRSAAGQYLLTRKEYARAAALITYGNGAADADRGLYAVALDGLGRRAEAEALVNTLLADTGGARDPNALMLRAKWALAAGKLERANADAQNAIEADGSNLDARLILAQSYVASEQPLRVRQVLAEAVRDMPRSRRALSAYLQYLQSLGDNKTALAAARSFADSNIAQPWGWNVLVAACQKVNDGGCAITAKRRYDISLRDFTFSNPSRPFKLRGLFSPLPVEKS